MQISYNNNEIASRCYEDFSVIYSIKYQEIFVLESVAMDVWRIIEKLGNIDADTIIQIISEEYYCTPKEVSQDIQDFLGDLFSAKIISIDGKYIEEDSYSSAQKISDDVEGEIISLMQEKEQLYSATFEMTYACNEKCIHCYAGYLDESEQHTEMNCDEYKMVIDQLYDMNCMHIAFTGGEPFAKDCFAEVFEYARKKGFVCDIYTNGVLLSENRDLAQRVLSRNPKTIYISLYGASESVHEYVTAVPGSFHKTINAIKTIRAMSIPVVINIMMLKENYSELNALIELAKKLDSEYRVGISIINKNNGEQTPMQHFIEDKNAIQHILTTVKEKAFSLDVQVTKTTRSSYLCGAGRSSLSIAPNGHVYPCISLKVPLGNVLSENLENIWSSTKRKRLADSLKWENTDECTNCQFLDFCPHCAGISKAESGSVFSCNTCDRAIAECLYIIENKNM